MSDILIVTQADFEEKVLKSDRPVILAVGAPWCADCRRLAPFFLQFAQNYGEKFVFASADSEQNPDLKEKLGIRHIPTLFFVKEGAIVDTLVEPKSPAPVREFLDRAVAAL